ncbi:MAG TPA: prolipoprotein diacylglyceryl transferase [Tepidisphaeraceae bacterium]|jgi:phosphatidylglycerol:prolipoprotein diacylglycerol transferase|nr:prolipoprotein diacylglyceryl transferase [Tepidisphaeraceae bacterium]
MRQIFFHIPFLNMPVYGYGVMLVVGLICGMYLAQALARRCKLDPELFANAAILALVTGILGARLSHVLENLRQYTNPELSVTQNFINAINIREGGLTYYGGFLLATPSLILYAMWKKIPVPLGMDIIAPCLMMGLGFGRIGCYLNGCCYGAECQAPWAVEFPYGSDAYVTQFDQNMLKQPVPRELLRPDHVKLADYMAEHNLASLQEPLDPELFRELNVERSLRATEGVMKDPRLRALAVQQHANPVHPAEIYSAVTAFLICAFLLAYFTLPHVPGRVFAGMMMIEGVFRYLLEMLRVEPAVVGRGTPYLTAIPPQSLSMVISFGLVIGGAVLWRVFGNLAAKRNPGSVALQGRGLV